MSVSMQGSKSTVNEYLENLPDSIHSKLYKSPATCLAIFRLLPSLSKFYIMTLIFTENATVSYPELNKWLRTSPQHHSNVSDALHVSPAKLYRNESLKRLKSLNLIKEIRRQITNPNTGATTSVLFFRLNPIFRDSLRNALSGGNTALGNLTNTAAATTAVVKDEEGDVEMQNDLNGMFKDENKDEIKISFLDKWSLSKWENILHFMVGSELEELPSVGVLSLLKHSGLMETHGKNDDLMNLDKNENKEDYVEDDVSTLQNMKITKEGFQFLLQDINSQIWMLLLQYLKISERLMMNPVDVLNFIFVLGSLELGKSYKTDSLSSTQKIMLDDLIDYGLIYQRQYPEDSERKDNHFFPTRLATSLTSDSKTFRSATQVMNKSINQFDKNNPSKDNGAIIIETNFKLYCYTDSPLQIAILNLFVHLRSRFSNMVCGIITRESIRKALVNGITAEQIIKYLETHAHSQMKKQAQEKLLRKIDFESSTHTNETSGRDGKNHFTPELEIIPPTVIDQIKLWQLELERIQTFRGFLFKDFNNDLEFEKLWKYATEIGVLLWKDINKRQFFVTQEGNLQVVEYANRMLRRQRSEQSTPQP
ncbi:hypothetical protein PACTADRAFT_3940 [Pachysolen tannophilus NRRL Y-2460]|uniref:RNA polymerase II transcription factor B subunit 2 n=1 Tax=Pachysolen tannophilus NRRL Y-2460 TaxID=669874 RepID=A0A1E4TTQ7_PACTA|nr:hypothetical protein PACTADRAFT_3940 [Pachysolen tannophilus NRRL Y-2460]